MSKIQLRRSLYAGKSGADVEAMKRMILDWRDRDGELREFMGKSEKVRQRFQADPWSSRVGQLNIIVNGAGAHPSQTFTSKSAQWLVEHGHADSLALHLLEVDRDLAIPRIVFPIAKGPKSTVCQGAHITSGIPGNVAIDFCTAAGSSVVAPEAGEIIRLSGHDPNDDTADRNGVFGWSIYLRTKAGYLYFITHLGTRFVKVGQQVTAGKLIGKVGNQRFRPDHAHVGVTSPFGPSDALVRMLTVSTAPKVAAIA